MRGWLLQRGWEEADTSLLAGRGRGSNQSREVFQCCCCVHEPAVTTTYRDRTKHSDETVKCCVRLLPATSTDTAAQCNPELFLSRRPVAQHSAGQFQQRLILLKHNHRPGTSRLLPEGCPMPLSTISSTPCHPRLEAIRAVTVTLTTHLLLQHQCLALCFALHRPAAAEQSPAPAAPLPPHHQQGPPTPAACKSWGQ